MTLKKERVASVFEINRRRFRDSGRMSQNFNGIARFGRDTIDNPESPHTFLKWNANLCNLGGEITQNSLNFACLSELQFPEGIVQFEAFRGFDEHRRSAR